MSEWKSLSPTLCDPVDYTVHGTLQARILEWVAFPFSKGSSQLRNQNPGLPHCRRILYQLSHKGSPRILEWVDYPFSRGSSRSRNRTQVSCIAGRFFTNWAIREAPAWGIHRPKERSLTSMGKGLHVSALLWPPRQSLEIPPLNSSPSQPGVEPGTSAWAPALNLVISLCLCFLF